LYPSPTIYGVIAWKKDELSGYVQYVFNTHECQKKKKNLVGKMSVRHLR